jgi:hypothetical protein
MKTYLILRASLFTLGLLSCASLPLWFGHLAREITDATRDGLTRASDFASDALDPQWVLQLQGSVRLDD